MGRKKKTTNTTVDNSTITQEKPTTDNIGYQGQVKISVQQGKKIISSKIYHNTGCINLFKFICNALAGNFTADLRPCKIALFKLGDSSDTPKNPQFNDTLKVTPFILNDTSAVVLDASTETTAASTVTYHFRIPYAYIQGQSIHKAALYGNSPADSTKTNICAWYAFANENTWQPIAIADTGNLSLIIEWTMTIKNNTGGSN